MTIVTKINNNDKNGKTTKQLLNDEEACETTV